MGMEACIKNGLRCSRYLGLFDCLVVHFWFHEYELTAEFIVNNNGSLDSIIIEGPVFYKPGEPMQIRVEVYTRHSVMRRHLTRGPENEDYLLIHAVCGDFNEELTVHYGNGDFVTNPCKYAREVGSIISQPSDDMTLRLVVGIMERLGITISIDELINSENCGKKY
ncbi:hypothetical protein [Vulcanisaeta souniana]|uniref:Uncharacterized protein n=1 Tax=Vulcanisaeta souniana JCM 11219 TaxID=1293586 RepID=A0A830EAC9_9CREN|nr:hypothetical protein [Vulcanisaeta souniana]BDR92660.1 hypothetical protein Vsou_17530 [Vulcanisaeta souniana JCM 11219]GGI84535.1 hypothetical protein GCM10007112_21950 [Vulcanisaeta souniana JCM 11219]